MTGAGPKRREERVKLVASALSNLGVAAIVAGLIGPLTAGRLDRVVALGDILLGFGLHLAAQCLLHYVVRAADESPEEAGQ